MEIHAMEIYADEMTDRVYVDYGRGPYTVIEPDGNVWESFTIPHAAVLVSDGDT